MERGIHGLLAQLRDLGIDRIGGGTHGCLERDPEYDSEKREDEDRDRRGYHALASVGVKFKAIVIREAISQVIAGRQRQDKERGYQLHFGFCLFGAALVLEANGFSR